MRTFLCFGALFISAANAGLSVYSTGSSRTHRADDGLGNYQFGYDEVHSTGGTFRRESGNAVGAKVGSYGLRDIDGRYRVVNYIADAAGFRAQVSTNEPGTAPSLTGAASYNAAPAPPLVASRLATVASPIYGTRVAQVAPAVAPVPAFSAPPVYSAPVRVSAPIAFGARVPVAPRVAYAAPAVAISTSAAAPITTYAAPVARLAPIAAPVAPAYAAPVVPSYATRLAAPIATYSAPVTRVAAPFPTYAVPAIRYAAPVRAYAAPLVAAPVAAYAPALARFSGAVLNSPLYAAPEANSTAAARAAAPAVPQPEAAPAALPYSANTDPRPSFPNQEVQQMSTDAPLQSAPASTLSTAESNSTEVLARPQTNQAVTFPYSTNFFAQRVNFSAPQFSFPSPAAAFDQAPFPFGARRVNSARNAPVSDAPVTPVPAFTSAAAPAVTSTPAPAAPVVNSTASNTFPSFNAPFPFAYSFPESDISTSQQQREQQPTTPAPAVSDSASATFAPRRTLPPTPSAPFLSAVNAAFPAGTYAGPIAAAPQVNETQQRSSADAAPSTPAPSAATTTDSPATFFSSRGDEVPFDHQITFSSQRLRAPIYAPVVAAAPAPIVPQYALYAPLAHYSSSVHTRVDFAQSAPTVVGRNNHQRQAPAAQSETSTTTPEVPRAPEQPSTPQPEAQTPSPQVATPAAETPRAQAPVEATTALPVADDDEDVADPRNAPPMFSARDETPATTTQAAITTTSTATETTVAPTTEVPVAAEANRQTNPVEQRSPAQNAPEAALLSADRPARVVARRRPNVSVYSSRVIRAPSAYRVFVPQYAHVKTAPVVHYAAAPVVIPKVGHVSYAVPAVRYY